MYKRSCIFMILFAVLAGGLWSCAESSDVDGGDASTFKGDFGQGKDEKLKE